MVKTKPSAAEALLLRLGGRNRADAFEAAKQVWILHDDALATPLVRVLQHGSRPFNRAAAAYAMQAISSPSTIAALEKAARNKSENSHVRGHAIEALAHNHRRLTHKLLRELLQDPSKDVRFWCAFSLGQMRDTGAVPLLKPLLSDKREVRGFHSVAKEAADAIATIQSEGGPHLRAVRKRGVVRQQTPASSR